MLTGKYITPILKSNALKSKEELNKLLKIWEQMTKGETIADLSKYNGNTVVVWIKLSDKFYKVNADTSRDGVIQYLENFSKGNENWTQVEKSGRISNNEDGTKITNFAMYRHS